MLMYALARTPTSCCRLLLLQDWLQLLLALRHLMLGNSMSYRLVPPILSGRKTASVSRPGASRALHCSLRPLSYTALPCLALPRLALYSVVSKYHHFNLHPHPTRDLNRLVGPPPILCESITSGPNVTGYHSALTSSFENTLAG